MTRISLETLTRLVIEYFRKHASRYGLDPGRLEASYILNWGGFVNASFTLTDGSITYHLKLADDEDSRYRLERWRVLAEILESRYHAPRMLDWVKIPRTPFVGALFAYIPGHPADLANQPAVLRGLLDLLARLHTDPALVTALELMDGPAGTCGEYFLDVYINRFDGDLLGVAGDLPPFVPLERLDWMMGETRELEGLARDLPAFKHPAASPAHGDLWSSNILVTESGEWYVIDWDDMALGDPALDYGILLGGLWRAGKLSLEQMEVLLPEDDNFPGLRERFQVCLRALVLDQVIDTLADWVEAGFAPEHLDEVRAEKERQHNAALALYRSMYSSGPVV